MKSKVTGRLYFLESVPKFSVLFFRTKLNVRFLTTEGADHKRSLINCREILRNSWKITRGGSHHNRLSVMGVFW